MQWTHGTVNKSLTRDKRTNSGGIYSVTIMLRTAAIISNINLWTSEASRVQPFGLKDIKANKVEAILLLL